MFVRALLMGHRALFPRLGNSTDQPLVSHLNYCFLFSHKILELFWVHLG